MRTWMWLAIALVISGLYGCSGDAQRDTKREQDRTAMQLTDAQRERDAAKAELDQLRPQLQDLQAKENATSDENVKLTQEIGQLRDQLTAKTMPAASSTEPAK